MNIILLSGGSGKRLWPLSNETNSKQFLRLLRSDKGEKESMVQRVFRQIKETGIDANIVIATGRSQVESINSQLGDVDIVVEPERRNTYPAILLASAYLKYKKNVDLNDSVLVLPVDPYAENTYFETLVKMDKAILEGTSDLTLMGIKPTYPSEKYGYIICEEIKNDIKKVIKFKEKPTLNEAKELLNKGAYWNAGVFGFKLGYLMNILEKEIKVSSFEELSERFNDLTSNSFDYEVVEKAKSINMISYNGEWKDLGTWNTLTEEMPDSHGNVVMGENNRNVSVINVTDKPVVVLGLEDAIVAVSTEGVLVSNKEKSSYLKPYVENINERPLFERKRWGEYRVIDQTQTEDGINTLTKHITVNKGKSISLQKHFIRDEVWSIIDGEGEITVDDKIWIVKRGDTVKISKEQKHKITAITDLQLIEIQIGKELIEEDIERFDYE